MNVKKKVLLWKIVFTWKALSQVAPLLISSKYRTVLQQLPVRQKILIEQN